MAEREELLREERDRPDLASLTAEVLKSAINNHLVKDVKDIADTAREIRRALTGEAKAASPTRSEVSDGQPERRSEPAVPINKSVTPEAIVCLECGKRFKSLKRHLSNEHQLTGEDYKRRWDLPHDYPMTAPAYSEQRSALAKSLGLGRKPAEAQAQEAPTTGGRGRGRKAA